MFGFGKAKISLDRSLHDRAAQAAAAAGYASVGDFVIHLLEREIRVLEEAEDEATVRRRLEGLGYID